MKKKIIDNQEIQIVSLDTIVIGTGCAGFNAADSLYDLNCQDIAILTEGIHMGTSRNAGSDKQTYYKLSLCSDDVDSIYELAKNLFEGGSVNGDTALAEAAGSLRSFMKLVELGVPFPTNQYGEYVGYKTDHDPRRRATSCGPLTSRIMTEKLESSVRRKGIRIYDRMQAIRLMVSSGKISGVLAINIDRLSKEDWGLTFFICNQVILATGGPAIVYEHSVYPESQTGMTGMVLEAGAVACNLQEWQYGLASTKFRWNVSGTYQQVLPRYIAVDSNGCEREFLEEYFSDPAQALNMIFLKGYQWPFDTKKIEGSSIIDIIVHHEIFYKGNRVYLDFRNDPLGLENGFEDVSEETRAYLARSGALIRTPIARLKIMNPEAIELYASHGIDLYTQPLEISVCAQHNNGGIAVDLNWESTIKGLYVAGEAAGTFGIARPGGSALNSTQVGARRAAEHIAWSERHSNLKGKFGEMERDFVQEVIQQIKLLLNGGIKKNHDVRMKAQHDMSRIAAHVRAIKPMERLAKELKKNYNNFFEETIISDVTELADAYKTRDMLLVQYAMLSAMILTGKKCFSRGAALVVNKNGTEISISGLIKRGELKEYCYIPGNDTHRSDWVATILKDGEVNSVFHPVRQLPCTNDWFENVWHEYNERRNRIV